MNIAPCKDCKDRHIGCHGKCEKYLEYKKELQKAKHREKINKKIEDDIWCGINEAIKCRRY